jgi:SAM-dependent methyltransferase
VTSTSPSTAPDVRRAPVARGLTSTYLRAVRIALAASAALPTIATACSHALGLGHGMTPAEAVLHVLGSAVLMAVMLALARRSEPGLDAAAQDEAGALDRLPEERVDLAIAAAAALSLFLELALIRWQGSVFELFALYKNLGLLACFAGLGLGYALSARERIPLAATMPLLAWQVILLTALRYGLPGPVIETNGQSWRIQSLLATPITEQRNIGFASATSAPQFLAGYALLSVVFALTALALLPTGQLAGRLMQRRPQLRAYALNLAGSLAGTALLLLSSFLWSPPAAWFAVAFAGLVVFQSLDGRSARFPALLAITGVVALAWPVDVRWDRIFSPYQLVERGPGEKGLITLRAAGHYYQRVHDLSPAAQAASADARRVAFYYEMAYRVYGRPADVLILGAGTGNDVAAALRREARSVDAVEIDPVILRLGTLHHPERPYDDPRVRGVVDDARTWLRTTDKTYDLVVYALLDSHTLLSHASSVRLESFVYTVEGLREARARLREDGLLSLSFAVVSKEIGRKIYMMMTEAFDGHPPLCLRGAYDGSVIFLQKKDGGLSLPQGLDLDRRQGFWVMERFEDTSVQADVSTDDWPFLYMAVRQYPTSYLGMAALVLVLSLLLTANFLDERPRFGGSAFFLLGAGFMLVETKAITELGLTFGNTWQVIGIAIAGILVMAFLATLTVAARPQGGVVVPFALLLLSLAAGWWVSGQGGFPPTTAGKLEAVGLLSLPLFFSGIVFARLLAGERNVASAMAMNLLGAMLGGLLEYNAMYFGFRFLYGLAGLLYLGALAVTAVRRARADLS